MTPHIDSRRFYRSTLSLMLSALLMAVALLGGCSEPEPTPTPSPVPTAPPAMATPALVAAAALTPTGTATSPTATPVLTVTVTVTVTATGCPAPTGWVRYTVAEGDTLSRLEATSGASVTALMQANCLVDTTIYVGQTLYLPVAPPPTATLTPEPTRCGAPTGWVVYVVQPGDTLSGLAGAVGAAVEDIRLANCLPDDTIYAGRGLRLPRLPGGTGVATAAGAAPVTVAESPAPRPPTPTCVGFACASAQEVQDPSIDFGPGSPAGGNLCSDAAGEVKISIGWRDAIGRVMVLPTVTPAADGTSTYSVGKELVFGACNVVAGEHVAFTLSQNESAPETLPAMTVNVAGTPVSSATWWAGCEKAGHSYKVSLVTDSPAMTRERTFYLNAPRRWAVFAKPLGGRRYQVYFCYANVQTNSIDLRLYHGKLVDGRCKPTTYRDGQTLVMAADATSGSYVLDLPLPGDTGDCYALKDMTTSLEPDVVILLPSNDG